ncbi:hypothetical protein PC123_g25933 [Phytophthora cactorum]|nr:hypothetical protein PC123_g25933 [Phytophthora cactorum]
MYQFPADKLQLFLAKTDDGAWLPDDDPVALQLEKGEIDDVRKTARSKVKANSRAGGGSGRGWWFSERDFRVE